MTDREKLARQWAEKTAPKGDRETLAAIEHILATTTPPSMADVVWDDEKHHLAGATTPNGIEVAMLWLNTGINHIATDDGLYARAMLTPNGKRYELREITEPDHLVEPSTKTMDEYSPAERADMVGMWAGYNRYEKGGEPEDFLIITGEETEAGRVPCYNPGAPIPHAWAPDKWMLTPRFDMPRVWGKDGEPCEPTVSFGENVGVDQPDHPEVLTTVEDYQNAPEGTLAASMHGEGYFHNETMSRWESTHGDWKNYTEMESSSSGRMVLRWGWGDDS